MHDVLACIYVIKNAIGCAHVCFAIYITRARQAGRESEKHRTREGVEKSRASLFRV